MEDRYPSAEGLDVEVRGPVLWLALNSPKRRNALDDVSIEALIRTLERAATDDDLRAIVLTGAGDTFCSGFDIVGRNAARDAGARKPRAGSIQRRLPAQANRLIPLMLEVQLPIVCAVRGMAVGIGAQMAVAADFTVAAREATFWYPFLRRGFTPDSGSTWLLPRLVGPVRARRLLMLDEKLSGAEAAEWGLVHEAVPDEDVLPATTELSEWLASSATVALGLTKMLLNASPGQDLTRHLADEAFAMELSSRSQDFREGMKAFTERRPPQFGGR
jgi:2-(1,2-epoxy-1,2-dihydrophenyl)acetyl-CoA isomerase